MKKLIVRFGSMLAALALVVTTIAANTTCTWVGFQPKMPDDAKKLRKF